MLASLIFGDVLTLRRFIGVSFIILGTAVIANIKEDEKKPE